MQGGEIILTEAPLTKLFDTDKSILHEIQRVVAERNAGNRYNSFPVVDVSIPQTITIDCPLVRPMLRSANKCKGCEYFKGVVQSAWSDDTEIPWSDKHGIRCGFILERKTRQLVVE